MKHFYYCCILVITHTSIQAQNQSQDTIHHSKDHSILNEITITGAGYEQKIKNTPATISVLTQKEIQKKAYRDITDALRDVPGVMITGGGSTSDISIRGANPSYTLILIDGKRVNSRETRPNSDNSGIEQGWMPPISSIKRIEVIKGPMSSLYGSDAMGGVINIITHKPSTRGWYGTIASDITVQENSDSGNLYQANANISGPIIPGKLGIKASGLYSEREEDKILGGYNEQKMKSGNLEFNGQLTDKDNLNLGYNYSRQDRISTPGLSASEKSKPSISNYERDSWALTHEGDYSKTKTLNYIQLDQSKNPGRDMKYKSLIINSNTNFSLYTHRITVGGEFRQEKLEDLGNLFTSPTGTLSELDRWNLSLFLEGNWNLLPRFNGVTAGRFEKDENYGTRITPRGYLIWNINEQFTLKGGVASGYKAPGLRQSSEAWGQITGGGGQTTPAVIIGNSDLKPETSFNQEITAMWENGKGISTSVTFYHTRFSDKLSTFRIDSKNVAEHGNKYPVLPDGNLEFQGNPYRFIEERINLDGAKMLGMELTLNWNFTTNFRIKNSYTFTQSEITSGPGKGYAVTNIPKHIIISTLEWDPTKVVQLWTRMNFQDKTAVSWGRSSTNSIIPSYILLDLGSVWKINNQLSITAGAYNLLNKEVTQEEYTFRLDGRRYQLGALFNF
ncbi:TonB-dependent receptor domain-containing protein [Flavobacterium sp. HSC-61S13]|uniref:TonB-dependent receptor domain-containing protein n=1 Tax=Flavobacterium sp. HSC-61S13 TaxID=2910963 RepID=UPI00209C777F|nr:TonB-dependent receptor [Flavobacterium sp. HSC-61S13]MCP1995542.1 outer membrane receptor for ferrienterochelin and colicins [Flavobacterium sp. HSC-61S13]